MPLLARAIVPMIALPVGEDVCGRSAAGAYRLARLVRVDPLKRVHW